MIEEQERLASLQDSQLHSEEKDLSTRENTEIATLREELEENVRTGSREGALPSLFSR